MSDTELNCLALMGEQGEMTLIDFAALAVQRGILGSDGAVYTCLSKISKSNLFIKKGPGKKRVYLDPALNILPPTNAIFQVNAVCYEPKESGAGVSANSKAVAVA